MAPDNQEEWTLERVENWLKENIPFKENEINDLLKRYGLDHLIEVNDLNLYYVLLNYRVQAQENNKDEQRKEEAKAKDYESISGLLPWKENRDPTEAQLHGITLNFSFNGRKAPVTLRSDFFVVPILELLGDMISHYKIPEQKKNKPGAKKSDNVSIIKELAPIAQSIKLHAHFKNTTIYNFIFDFLQICEFNWDDTGWTALTEKDIRSLKIQTIKKHLGPSLKKGK